MCERVVEERVRAGLPGVAIQWGGVGDVGVLADTLGEIEVCWPCTAYVQCSLKCMDLFIIIGLFTTHSVSINVCVCSFIRPLF